MDNQTIIGREREKEQLRQCLNSDRSELVIIYGRRRVGKTFLVDEFFHKQYDFTYTGGHKLTQRVQLRYFAKALKVFSGRESLPQIDDWFSAFDLLEEYLSSLPSDRKKTVFIDEMPWIDTTRSDFTAAFENFWNGWAARRRDIVFIASGSATSWMVDNLIENQGGLHARITRRIYLRPFTLHETELYLKSRNCLWDRFQIAQCYMYFGGIPFYLSLIEPQKSLIQNVNNLCFSIGGTLTNEFNELYNALFVHSDNYITIIRLLAEHRNGVTFSTLSKKSGIDGSRLTKILTNLERCDFIMKFRYYGKKNQDSIFKLKDFFTLFYLKFIEPNIDLYDEQWWTNNSDNQSVITWQGLTFELLCITHIKQIRNALQIGGVATEVTVWFDKPDRDSTNRGSQIDLIIERADRIIHLCEMKFTQGKYRITSDYEEHIRNRMELFREKTSTKKTLVNTFITTYGVADGIHKSIVHSEVCLDQLFDE